MSGSEDTTMTRMTHKVENMRINCPKCGRIMSKNSEPMMNGYICWNDDWFIDEINIHED